MPQELCECVATIFLTSQLDVQVAGDTDFQSYPDSTHPRAVLLCARVSSNDKLHSQPLGLCVF
jgi:hypothetical protein